METGRGQLGWGHKDHGQGSRGAQWLLSKQRCLPAPGSRAMLEWGQKGPGNHLPQGGPHLWCSMGHLQPPGPDPSPRLLHPAALCWTWDEHGMALESLRVEHVCTLRAHVPSVTIRPHLL